MPKNDAYQTIAEMWDFPESESFRKSLEALFTLEEAELLLQLREPVTAAELAVRLKRDEKSLAEKLDDFVKRGLIFKGKTQYQFRREYITGSPTLPAYHMQNPRSIITGGGNG